MDSRPQKVYKLGPMRAYKAEKDLRWYSEQIHQFCITGPNNRGHTVNKVQKKKIKVKYTYSKLQLLCHWK